MLTNINTEKSTRQAQITELQAALNEVDAAIETKADIPQESLDLIKQKIGEVSPQMLVDAGLTDECRTPATEDLYDIVYMDANKREYCEYYDLVFDMVRPGGLILADNVLWDGKVCQDPLPQDKQTLGIVAFNDMVSADPRVESVILPLRDGLNLIRKKA